MSSQLTVTVSVGTDSRSFPPPQNHSQRCRVGFFDKSAYARVRTIPVTFGTVRTVSRSFANGSAPFMLGPAMK
jgi:hypothetical protein